MMKNMPLRNKFAVKKTPPRRSLSLNNLNNLESSIREETYGLHYDAPKIKIAGQEFKFDDENGMWTSGNKLILKGQFKLIEPFHFCWH